MKHTRAVTTRRAFLTVGGAAALGAFGTACGQRLPRHSRAELRGRGDVAGDIRFAWWGAASRHLLSNDIADIFESDHPEANVQREPGEFGNYFKRLNVQAAGRNLPDVTQMQARQLNDFTERDALLPLDPMLDSGAIDVSEIPDAVLETGRGPDGRLYMLPTGAAYDAVTVNATLAEQAGVELPGLGYDWDDFAAFLRAARDGLPPAIPPAGLSGGLPNFFIAYVQGHGEQMFDGRLLGFSRELLVTYWEMWEEMRHDGLTNTPESNAEEPPTPEASYVAQGALLSDVTPGNALTPIQATLDGTQPGQRLTTLPLPSGPAGGGNVLISSGMSIPRNCDNVPTAAAFVDFWANDARSGDTYASDNGGVTNTRLLQRQVDDPELPRTKRHELRLYQRIVEREPALVIYPPGYMAVFESAFLRAYEDVSFGHRTVREAVDAFFEEANAGLAT
ncbi:ABC transporter substrate-binding protein [Streptomyces sp. B6B3]|uniref:ABC transporter substrate-binding protein n=1 Tax=Streptomyces sp. B6B3 TaxID=3153570 RepID=UPI00325ECD30